MKPREYIIRTMTRSEVGLAVDWAAGEGWNPGVFDADCFYAADPEGFLVGLLDGEPVACISVIRYGQSFGFLGCYIVRPGFRGQGFGLRIWNAGLERLRGRVVGLDGVVAQQENYKRSGFASVYRNVRRQGRGRSSTSVPTGCGSSTRHFPNDVFPDVVALSTLPFGVVEAYDRPLFPDDRACFLRCWIGQEEGRALGVLREGGLAGYGVIRKCRVGHKIGPLFADGPELAEKLLEALTFGLGPEDVFYLDTPEVNSAAVALADRRGMETVFETARMYKGEVPSLPVGRIFGVTTFELG